VGVQGVLIGAVICGHALIFCLFCPSVQFTDYCYTQQQIVGAEQQAVHVCGDIIC
jgi:hypothetical protein